MAGGLVRERAAAAVPAAAEDGLAARIEKITVRLAADAPGLELRGAELIGYYCPGPAPA